MTLRCLTKDDVWLGFGTIVLPGVRIGTGSIVGARSVVTKDIPARVIACGNPARVIRRIEVGDRAISKTYP